MKRNIVIIGIVLVVGIIAVVSFSNKSDNKQSKTDTPSSVSNSSETSNTNDAKPAENQINIKDFAFTPAKMTIKKGTTITWTNQDSARHDITPDSPSETFKASKLLAKGESFSFTFNEVGSFSYHCSPHPYMKAVIEVTE